MSADECIKEQVAELAGLLAKAQTGDPQTMVFLRRHFEAIARWAEKMQEGETASLASGAAELVEKIMIAAYPGDNASFSVLISSAESLREIILDGRNSGEVTFPAFPPEM